MTGYRVRSDIQLPLPTALWVLAAHAIALFIPFVLIVAVNHHWAALQELTDYPVLFYVAAGVMMAGSAFEIAQNAVDKWYLTPETGSAEGTGFCDFMFFWLIVASQGLVLVACKGAHQWTIWLSVFMVVLFPFLYVRQKAHFVPLAVLGLGSTVGAYISFGDPVIILQLLLSPLTMYFFDGLLKTGNQILHGFTTLAASSGVLFLAWGMHGGSEGIPQSWFFVIAVILATVVIAAVIRPVLLALPATARPGALGD